MFPKVSIIVPVYNLENRIEITLNSILSQSFSDYEIIVINDTDDKANETEIFEEIISMLHCFAMRMYSRRRKKKLEIMEEDLKNEISL